MASSSRDRRSTLSFFFLSLISLFILALYIGSGKDSGNSQAGVSHLKNARAETAAAAAPSSFPTSSPATGNSSLSSSLQSDGEAAPFGFAARFADDDPYTCGPGRPCSNGACCGASGNCGYAPAYCGAGCTSNCDAKAECGQYAVNPGQTCKLNACCSEHGFCGTTEDFCTDGCQSNCILEPKPPGGSPKDAALDRVIGYYESWSYKSKCNQKSPSDLPLKDLTHLNYAFTFIEPGTYEMVTMDMKHQDDLWQITVDSKKYNPSLKVFVAVGGWTFSDNGTVTQPLFGEIASTEANRQKFADGVFRFLNKYGFDGLDIDWEYPGAGDRGGRDEDVPNFVLLMKTLRQTFDASPRKLGLTFTIPSSFWYLRWFDMPGLLQYADWTNLMSYDLHGTWDEHNPIGSIAQAHTNLTEIKLATQLLWRVGVRPEQVVLGYGFYGRAFELADPSCTTPGCPFAGGARKGPCSDEAGILMYYEIQAILKKYPNLKPVFDEKAAVKYLTWDNNQWISFDDAETFKLKLKWANEMGFGGSMVWAVDTDDDKFSAMSGLLGYQVSHLDTSKVDALAMTDSNVAATVKLENGQGCYVHKKFGCAELANMKCPKGEEMVAYDRNGCGKEDGTQGVPVCCPTGSTSKKCIWRGTPKDGGLWGDCNGQCHAGESMVAGSSWGGGSSADTNWPLKKCGRGGKVLCCEANNWKTIVNGCSWTSCLSSTECGSNQKKVATRKGSCPNSREQSYCCPKDTGLHECKWRGSAPDCVDSNCKSTEDGKDIFEVQVDAHGGGSSWNLCSYDRKKALCCQLRVALPKPLTCKVSSCDLDYNACSQDRDEWGNHLEPRADAVAARGEQSERLTVVSRDEEDDEEEEWTILNKRRYRWITSFGTIVTQYSLPYPSRTRLMRQLRQGLVRTLLRWEMRSNNCGKPGIKGVKLDLNGPAPSGSDVEHTLPMVIISRFASVAQHAIMWAARPAGHVQLKTGKEVGQAHPSGQPTKAPAAGNEHFWAELWANAQSLPANLPRVSANSPDLRSPVARLYEAVGSTQNPTHFVFLQDNVNAMKGRVEIFNAPMGRTVFDGHLTDALNPSRDSSQTMTSVESFLAPLRELASVYEYYRQDEIVTNVDAAAAGILAQLQLIELNMADARGLTAQWNEFYPAYFRLVGDFARGWARDRIAQVRRQYGSRPNAHNRAEVEKALKEIEDDIPKWKHPAE